MLHAQVIGYTCGKWLGVWALILTVLNLMGNGCAQVGTDEAPRGFLSLRARNIPNRLKTLITRDFGHRGCPDSLSDREQEWCERLSMPSDIDGVGADCGWGCQHLLHQSYPVEAVGPESCPALSSALSSTSH